jgi:predicted alpha/beta hydrolase
MSAHSWRPAAAGGHEWNVMHVPSASGDRVLVWLPALGVTARNYAPLAQALAARGVSVVVHEWRGFGSSSRRASRTCDWGYRELLLDDIAATRAVAEQLHPGRTVILGGHSLGGQLACCSAAIDRDGVGALWLVASGSPYAGAFPPAYRPWLPFAYRLLASLAQACGALPGRRIGFGGQEARGVIRDWSRTALSGRYGAPGVDDLEARLREVAVPVRGVVLDADWLAPMGSLDFLTSKLGTRERHVDVIDATRLGVRADHFAWMRQPVAVVDALLA